MDLNQSRTLIRSFEDLHLTSVKVNIVWLAIDFQSSRDYSLKQSRIVSAHYRHDLWELA